MTPLPAQRSNNRSQSERLLTRVEEVDGGLLTQADGVGGIDLVVERAELDVLRGGHHLLLHRYKMPNESRDALRSYKTDPALAELLVSTTRTESSNRGVVAKKKSRIGKTQGPWSLVGR